ncbi:MAG: site-specific DNA-methyltransferase [Bacteroidetes bacterium]|nr:MAG: site-specific DNA-methyltransferase [Bacteroidota bacterium]
MLKTLENETVDLIYIDPPFFSNRTYEVIWGDKGEIRSFEDRFSGGIEHYISWLKERIQEMHRILKPTGSIFVHCDYHADAYIRVSILDKIFSGNNFRNKITWKRADTHNDAKKQMPNISDDIFLYSKSEIYTFNVQYGKHADKTLKEWYQYLEFPDGTVRKMTKEEKETQTFPKNARRFNADNMANPSRVWEKGLYEYKGYSPPSNGWRYALETMKKLDSENLLLFPKNKTGRIMRKRYLEEQKGAVIGDVWDDISQIRSNSKERIGYPTQKPEKLLERIIQMASNENDVILDCFVGGGTTISVADKLNRSWIGIDQSVQAVKVTEFRLNKQQGLFSKPFSLQLHKYDYDLLRYKDAFEFETWIVGQFGGIANTKQRGDLGLDGRTRENQPIQVKRSDGIGRNVIDNFKSACERFDKASFEKNKAENKPVGFIIAFSFGKGAIEEIARLRNEENVLIKLVTVEEIVPIAKKPTLQVEMQDLGKVKELRQISFVATGQSEAGIEFFAWDFAYNESNFVPEILLDKTGKQSHLFKAGEHRIAVKVVDNQGLENIEIIKLKVNGEIKRCQLSV